MNIAVVIVNYNTRDLVCKALHSVYRAQRPADCTLTAIVVDNASRDQSAERVAAEFPQATLFASPINLGFTGGNNLALHALGLRVDQPAAAQTSIVLQNALAATKPIEPPTFVLLLNPDAEITEDFFIQMLAQMERLPNAAICGAHLRYGDQSFQHGAFYFPSLAQVALDFFPLIGVPGAYRLRNSRVNGRYSMSLWQGTTAFPVDFVLGAAMFVRAEAINAVGGLDGAFFMYCEEMDWALRMHEAGWQVYAVPTARVTHHEAQSSRQTRWDSYERLWRSRFRFYAKHAHRYPPIYQATLRLLVRVGMVSLSRQARQRFAAGMATGTETARELAAYANTYANTYTNVARD